jgi:hypothetical protein
MENSLPNITSRHRPIWSDFLGPNPLQSPTSSSGGTYIASGDARQIAGNINTTFTGPVEKVEAHYYGEWVLILTSVIVQSYITFVVRSTLALNISRGSTSIA